LVHNSDIFPVYIYHQHNEDFPVSLFSLYLEAATKAGEYKHCYYKPVSFEELSPDIAIKGNYLPRLYRVTQELGIDFSWRCSECGEAVGEPPYYHLYEGGNGGVGILVDNFICLECADPCAYCGEPTFGQDPCPACGYSHR